MTPGHPSARVGSAVLALGLALAGCGSQAAAQDDRLEVVTTTEVLADMVRAVGGEHVAAASLVPPGGDPHSYEPVPADAARIAKADVTFTNHLLLERQALVKAIDANTSKSALNLSLAENSEAYGAHLIPLVENLALDVVWLGLRVRGDTAARGADRTSEIVVRATEVEGPGALVMYVTETLGQPVVHFDSRDGIGDADRIALPPGAHTHVNWAFSKPGVYRLSLASQLLVAGQAPVDVGAGTFAFAVGVDPAQARVPDAQVIDGGHTDFTVDLDKDTMYPLVDPKVGTDQRPVATERTVISVPEAALSTVPDDPRFSFLGSTGARFHQLPQAVIGRHVHGELDPHLWQDVRNVAAYVQLIRDTLIKADPGRRAEYEANTTRYLAELDGLHAYVRQVIETIPPQNRDLITTHDAFGYLAQAYGMKVVGFVVPNPAQEPSAQQVRDLAASVISAAVPAVFAEPNLIKRASVLRQVAADAGVQVCQVYGDAFDAQVNTYVRMMRHNAEELARCLGGRA